MWPNRYQAYILTNSVFRSLIAFSGPSVGLAKSACERAYIVYHSRAQHQGGGDLFICALINHYQMGHR